MGISGIYTITNLENGKVYIGSTSDFKGRWNHHRQTLRHNIHRNVYLQRSWNKYGKAVFKFGVLEYLDNLGELTKAEQFWLDVYKEEDKELLYNIALTTDCPRRGRPHTEETKRKISKSHMGLPGPMKGRKHSKETKQKIRKAIEDRWYIQTLSFVRAMGEWLGDAILSDYSI